MRLIWIAGAILIACNALAELGPQPKQTQGSASSDAPANNHHETTTNPSTTVHVDVSGELNVTTKSAEENGADEQKHWWDNSSATNALIALFTLLLVGVGVGQIVIYWKQKGVMENALQSTNRQIALARDEFNATHRPKIRVRHFNIHIKDEAEPAFNPARIFDWSFTISNIGDTPIKKIYVTYAAKWGNSFSEVINEFWNCRNEVVVEDDLLPGRSKIQTLEYVRLGGNIELMRVSSGSFFVVGQIRYVDSAGIDRYTGFCRRCDQYGARDAIKEFSKIEGVDYEYED